MTTHCMIDLETLGTKPGSAILSIGAVIFSPAGKLPDRDESGNLPESITFYANIEIKTSVAAGFTVDQSTIDWWKKQDPKARNILLENKKDVAEVFKAFYKWCRDRKVKYPWSHGVAFDVVLLECGYDLLDGPSAPWNFYDARDTRTLYDIAGVKPNRGEGVHHYALDDAINQAVAVQKAYRKLGIIV